MCACGVYMCGVCMWCVYCVVCLCVYVCVCTCVCDLFQCIRKPNISFHVVSMRLNKSKKKHERRNLLNNVMRE